MGEANDKVSEDITPIKWREKISYIRGRTNFLVSARVKIVHKITEDRSDSYENM